MARITNSSSSIPLSRQGGVVEALRFRAWTPRDTDGEFGCDWYVLNLENGVISMTLSRMPPAARLGSTAVACSNQIFVLGGVCRRNSTCPDGKRHGIHLHDYVFYFDYDHPENGWRRASLMLFPRMDPCAVTLDGKIYVFGGSSLGHFAEVFNIKQNRWAVLPPPPSFVDPVFTSHPVLADSPRSRILVHFACNNSLYAYNVGHKSWQCLNENFGNWSTKSVIVEDVLYFLVESREDDVFCFSEKECSLRAYDVVENKHLLVKWLPKFEVCVPWYADLYHLGNGTMCLAGFATLQMHFEYIKFSVCKNSGEVHATAESESVTSVPFETGYFQTPML